MIHNLKYFLLASIILPLLLSEVSAQKYTLQKQVIGTGGSHAVTNNSEYKLSGISGQLAIGLLKGQETVDSPIWNNYQGFWTPDAKIPVSVDNDNYIMRPELVNYPNPVNGSTTIQYELKYSGYVSLKVYNIVGNEVASLLNEYQSQGEHNFTWDVKDGSGMRLPSGSYLYELTVSPSNMAGTSSLYDAYKLRNVMVIVD